MGLNINQLLGLEDPDQNGQNLPPVPLRPDYQAQASEAPAPMNPVVKDYLMKKAAPPQEAAPAEAMPMPEKEEPQDPKAGLGWLQLAAGVGDAFAGRSSAQTAQNFDGIRKNIDLNDPNSQKSKTVQATISRLYSDKFTPEQISKITAGDADLVYKPLELKAKLDQAKSSQEMAHEDRMLKNEVLRQSQQEKSEKNQGDAYQKATHDLNTFRGNNAVQQASIALTNAKNALSLADRGKLSPDQLHLFASELGKLATGGVPGGGEIEALIPDTAKTRLAKVQSFFSNNPTDAEAQAFIENNRQYLHELVGNYQGVVDKYRDNVLDGYKKKLSPQDFNDLKSRYSVAKTPGAGKPQTVTQNGHTYTLNPQTGEYE